MKKTKKILYCILTCLISNAFAACTSEDKIEGYKAYEILVVTLEIEDNICIEKITLNSSYSQSIDSILQKELINKTIIKLKCPQKGEGTYSICVFTNVDTLCSRDSYIEGGYRPQIKLKNGKFEIIKWN